MVASVSGESRDMIFDPFVVFLMYPTEVPVFIEDISIGGLENSYGQDCSEVSPLLEYQLWKVGLLPEPSPVISLSSSLMPASSDASSGTFLCSCLLLYLVSYW